MEKTEKRDMVRMVATVSHNCIHTSKMRLSGLKRVGIKYKKLPRYCTIEVDLNSIKPRKKGEIE